jgi:hypothetical protein
MLHTIVNYSTLYDWMEEYTKIRDKPFVNTTTEHFYVYKTSKAEQSRALHEPIDDVILLAASVYGQSTTADTSADLTTTTISSTSSSTSSTTTTASVKEVGRPSRLDYIDVALLFQQKDRNCQYHPDGHASAYCSSNPMLDRIEVECSFLGLQTKGRLLRGKGGQIHIIRCQFSQQEKSKKILEADKLPDRWELTLAIRSGGESVNASFKGATGTAGTGAVQQEFAMEPWSIPICYEHVGVAHDAVSCSQPMATSEDWSELNCYC